MLFKPGKSQPKVCSAAPVVNKRPHRRQHKRKQITEPNTNRHDQDRHQPRWPRLGHLISSLSQLSLFGSHHNLAGSGGSSSSVGGFHDHHHHHHHHQQDMRNPRDARPPTTAVSCQNLAAAAAPWTVSKSGRPFVFSDEDEAAPSSCGVNRVAKWATGLGHLLTDSDGVCVFAEFLRTEFSEENVRFWLAVEDFRRLQVSPEELLIAARRIGAAHIGCDAPESVNLDGATERNLQSRLSLGLPPADSDMFDAAQRQIFSLMQLDSYARFLKSPSYKDCLLCEMESQPLPITSSPPTTVPVSLAASKSTSLCRSSESLLADTPLTSSTVTKRQPQTRHKIWHNGKKRKLPDSSSRDELSVVVKTDPSGEAAASYRSRQPSFIVAALDLDCGYSVC